MLNYSRREMTIEGNYQKFPLKSWKNDGQVGKRVRPMVKVIIGDRPHSLVKKGNVAIQVTRLFQSRPKRSRYNAQRTRLDVKLALTKSPPNQRTETVSNQDSRPCMMVDCSLIEALRNNCKKYLTFLSSV